jgi:hypothetical protein
LRAVAAIARDVDAGDLELVVVRADQDRCAGIAAAALAGVQEELAAAGRLAQLAITIGGHGVAAVLPVAGNLHPGAARRRLPAEPERRDFVGHIVNQGQHHPVGADGFTVLVRVIARADFVMGDARVRQVPPTAVAREEMQRPRGQKAPASVVVDAVRRGHDLVTRNNHPAAGAAGAVIERADGRPRMARYVHVLAMSREMIALAGKLRRLFHVAGLSRY